MSIVTAAQLEAIRTGFQAIFATTYATELAASFYKDVATTVPSGAASETYGWLGDFPDLIEWIGDRTVKSMKENGYLIENKDWESTVSVKRTAIMDDTLGVYNPMVRTMAQAAARHPERMVAALIKNGTSQLCYDGQNFFDTDHPVAPNVDGTGVATTVSNWDDNAGVGTPWYLLDTSRPLKPFIFQERMAPEFESKTDPSQSDTVFTKNQYQYGIYARNNTGYGFWQMAYGSRRPLNGDNFDLAFQAMQEFKGDGGKPLGITPTRLVVPPSLRSAANKTIKVMLGEGGASNANYDAVDVMVVPWLV